MLVVVRRTSVSCVHAYVGAGSDAQCCAHASAHLCDTDVLERHTRAALLCSHTCQTNVAGVTPVPECVRTYCFIRAPDTEINIPGAFCAPDPCQFT